MLYEELIISSGGIYIVHYIGALIGLNKYMPLEKFKYYTGCSAGGVLCTLLVLGYTIEEIKTILLENDITEYQDLKIANFIDNYGFDNGDKCRTFFKAFFTKKGFHSNITFLELYEKNPKILTLTVTNITKKSVEYHNIFSTPYMKVLDSVLMSMNIPILFKPIKYSLTYIGNYQEDHYYLDGSLIDPFPWKVIKKVNILKKIGIFKSDYQENVQNNHLIENQNLFMDTFQNYFMNMIETILKDITKEKYKFLKDDKISKNIFIFNDHLNSIDFSMSSEMKKIYMNKTEQLFNDFYLKSRRTYYLSKKYFYLWYNKIKNKN